MTDRADLPDRSDRHCVSAPSVLFVPSCQFTAASAINHTPASMARSAIQSAMAVKASSFSGSLCNS
jgi:hypothetical protein